MNGGTLDTAALQQLDEEPRQLLDTIDSLRYLGVDSYVELPQIIVVGDQSSGKSSVLEAISRVKFPAKNGLCTRFATELVLRTSPEPKVEVRIIHPGQESNDNNPDQPLESFNKSKLGQDELAKIMEEAKAHMGLGPNGIGFSERVLRVQIQGPELPQLTLVDLPGFYHSETEEQTAEGREVVESLAAKYMAQKCSIILAVISAKSEIAGQIVLHKARQYDPRRERTLGIITKPDTLERSSSEESKYLQLAKNEESSNQLKLGWHVLRNRTESEARASNDERDQSETEFLQSGVWKNVSSANKGVAELRSRLSSVLFDHIRQNLPDVIRGIEGNITKRRLRLDGLGNARSTPAQHRAYLGAISKRFETLARDAIRGLYTDDGFFGGLDSDMSREQNPRKLRARVRQLNRAFAVVLSESGAKRVIRMPDGTVPFAFATNPPEFLRPITQLYRFDDPIEVSWGALNAELELDAVSDQGTEFPGSMNPWLAFQLFKKQALPWNDIAVRHIELIMDVTRQFIDDLLEHVAPDAHTHETILAECVEPFFDKKKELLASKLEELLDHYRGDYASQMDGEFLYRLSERVANRVRSTGKGAAQISEFDTESAIDSMLTYYEMSLRTFTENVMILAVENCLIRKIPDIFESTMVSKMDDEMLARLASETRAVRDERKMLERDLGVLERGLKECKRHRPRELAASRPSRPSVHQSSASVTPSVQLTETQSPQPPATSSVHGLLGSHPVRAITNRRASRRAHVPPDSFSSTDTLSHSPSLDSSRQSASQPATPPSISFPSSSLPNYKSTKPTKDRSNPSVFNQSQRQRRLGQTGRFPRSPFDSDEEEL